MKRIVCSYSDTTLSKFKTKIQELQAIASKLSESNSQDVKTAEWFSQHIDDMIQEYAKTQYTSASVKEFTGKDYVKANSDDDWQSQLDENVLTRLAECRSTKRDIVPLTKAFYQYSHKVQENSMSKEDCLIYILEWVLDWNGGLWDYTKQEYDKWLKAI